MTPKEIGRQAGRIFHNVLPHYLVLRNQQDQEDYGIDYEIEIMLADDKPSGNIFKVQEKGTTNLKLIAAGTTISFSDLDIPHMRYYLQEIRIPAALVVVDVTNMAAYWVRLQGNVQVEDAFRDAVGKNQGSLTVHIPVRNKLPETLPQFLEAMVQSQDAVMLRFMREITGQQLLEAARSVPDFDATLRASTRQHNILRLEHIERMKSAGDLPSAFRESQRIWASESETTEVRIAAGLNLMVMDGPMQPGSRGVREDHDGMYRRLTIAARMRSITSALDVNDRLRIFAEFQHHIARISDGTNRYVGLLNIPAASATTPEAALVRTAATMATRQLMIDILSEFQEAHARLVAIIQGGHTELVAQAWAMLLGDTVIFIQILRNTGRAQLADTLTSWFDNSLDIAVTKAERMSDWRSSVFCGLQQMTLAPLGNAVEIERRAGIARMIIGRTPADERAAHLAAVDERITMLSGAPPVPRIEAQQEMLRLMLLSMGGSIGDDADPISRAINLAIQDMNPERALKICQQLYVFKGGSSALGRAFELSASGMKWLYCTRHRYHFDSVSLDTAFAGFCSEYCDKCADKNPHPADWKWTPDWQAEQDRIHGAAARERPTLPGPPSATDV